MASPSGLGAFERLPRELRDEIYEYLMHWNNYDISNFHQLVGMRQRVITYADYKEACEIVRSRCANGNHLAILRSSKVLHSEVTDMLYGWHLELTHSSRRYKDSCRPTNGYFPRISVRIHHTRHGIYDLGVIGGKEWSHTFSENGHLEYRCITYEDNMILFRNMPHHCWQSVTIQIEPLEEPISGSLRMGWQASKIIAWAFQTHRPSVVQIRAPEHLDTEHHIIPTDKRRNFRASTLDLLLMPLMYLQDPSNPLRKPNDLSYRIPDSCLVRCAHGHAPTRFEFLKARSLNSPHERLISEVGPPDGRAQSVVDLWFDASLDSEKGDIPFHLRLRRWRSWDLQYEGTIIEAASKLRPVDRQRNLLDLAERWAVMRTLDYSMRKVDDKDWQSETINVKALEVSEELYDSRHVNPRGWRGEEDPRHWMASDNPSKDDAEWCRLKCIGLFYKRRILITSDGLMWDPHHQLRNRKDEYVPQIEDVMLVHEPPIRPTEQSFSSLKCTHEPESRREEETPVERSSRLHAFYLDGDEPKCWCDHCLGELAKDDSNALHKILGW